MGKQGRNYSKPSCLSSMTHIRSCSFITFIDHSFAHRFNRHSFQFSTWANFDSDESLEVVELSFDGGVPSRGDGGNDVTDGVNDDGGNSDAGGLGAQSFSELYLTGESSAGI